MIAGLVSRLRSTPTALLIPSLPLLPLTNAPAWWSRPARAAAACPLQSPGARGAAAPAPAAGRGACQRWRQSPRRWRCEERREWGRWAAGCAGCTSAGQQAVGSSREVSLPGGQRKAASRRSRPSPHGVQHAAHGVGHRPQQALPHPLDGACRLWRLAERDSRTQHGPPHGCPPACIMAAVCPLTTHPPTHLPGRPFARPAAASPRGL